MTRVLHVIDSLDLGGAQTALLEFLRFADRSRFHCEVAAMHGPGVFYDAFRDAARAVHVLSPRKWMPLYVPRLFWLLKSGGYDIAHFHLFGANWIGKPLAALAGVGIRFNHDQCNDVFRSQNRMFVKIDSLTNRLSTRVIAVSQSTRKFLLEQEGLQASRVECLPNSVDTESFLPPAPAERIAARRQWGCDPGALVVAGIGRLHPQKNFRMFLEVASAFRGRREICFILAGDGPEEGMLKAMASVLGLGGTVRLVGFVKDTRSLYAATDVLLLTSLYEGLPMVLLEAMASGCVFVGSRVDGVQEVIREGVDGLLAAPQDSSGFASHLNSLLDDVFLRDTLAAAARRRVVEAFDSRIITGRLESLYDAVLKDCQPCLSSTT